MHFFENVRPTFEDTLQERLITHSAIQVTLYHYITGNIVSYF